MIPAKCLCNDSFFWFHSLIVLGKNESFRDSLQADILWKFKEFTLGVVLLTDCRYIDASRAADKIKYTLLIPIWEKYVLQQHDNKLK